MSGSTLPDRRLAVAHLMLRPEHPDNQRIRVLHIITRMVRGGAQFNTLSNCARLNDGPWESLLAAGPSTGAEGSIEDQVAAEGVRFVPVPHLQREIALLADLRALGELVRLIRAERLQVVHTHMSKAGVLGRIAARLCGVPVVIHTPHGHVFHSYSSRAKTALFIWAERWCARWCRRLITLTEHCKQDHLDFGIAPIEKFVTIHSGVDFAPFLAARGKREETRRSLDISEGTVVIGTVGRLVPIKGQCHLLEAFARLRDAVDLPLLLMLVGDGELHDDLTAQARTLGIEDCTRFLGLRKDVPELLTAMDVFALPSLNEGMGRVLVEAMALELPIVASRVGGIPDVVIEGETGLLVESANPAELASALKRLVESPEEARRLARAGRAHAVPGFGVESMVDQIAALYRELLAERGISVPEAPAGSTDTGRTIAAGGSRERGIA